MNHELMACVEDLFGLCEDYDAYPRVIERDDQGEPRRALLVTDDPEVIEQLVALGLLEDDS